MAFTMPEQLPDTIEALDELEQALRARFDELQGEIGEEPTEEQVSELEALADALDQINEHREDVAARASRAAVVAEKFGTKAEPQGEAEPQEPEAQQELAAEPKAPEAPAEPAAASEPQEPKPEYANQGTGAAAPAGQKEKADMPQNFGGAVGGTVNPADTGAGKEPERKSPFSINRNVDTYKTGPVELIDLAEAMDATLSGRVPSGGDGVGGKAQFGHINRDFPEELTVPANQDAGEAIDYATNEKNVKGGSLVAAAGWCAPSETLYDFLPIEPLEGLLSMPEISITRGGVRYPNEPDFSALYQHDNFLWTEADAIAGTKTKDCVEIPCVGMTEHRLDATWVCITSNLLANVGWPELTARYLAEALRAYEHRKSSYRLSKLQADANGVAVPESSVLGATAAILNAAALQAQDLRIKYRTGRTIEGVFPLWTLELMRADLAYREDVLPDQVPDARIVALFAERNINVQFVADLQTDVIGAAAAATAWPKAVEFYLYPAGAWFSAVQPVVNLAAQYSPELLSKNQRSELFIEDGVLAARRGFETRKVTVPVKVAGQVGQRVALGGAAAGGGSGN